MYVWQVCVRVYGSLYVCAYVCVKTHAIDAAHIIFLSWQTCGRNKHWTHTHTPVLSSSMVRSRSCPAHLAYSVTRTFITSNEKNKWIPACQRFFLSTKLLLIVIYIYMTMTNESKSVLIYQHVHTSKVHMEYLQITNMHRWIILNTCLFNNRGN